MCCVNVFLEQTLVGRVQLGIRIGLVQVPVDQVDCDSQVVFSQDIVLVVSFKRRRIVLYEPVTLEWVGDELQVEWDVGKGVRILDSSDQLGSGGERENASKQEFEL